jgi:hypothetical protein
VNINISHPSKITTYNVMRYFVPSDKLSAPCVEIGVATHKPTVNKTPERIRLKLTILNT